MKKIKNFFQKFNKTAPNAKLLRSTLLFTLVIVLVMGVAVFAWFAIAPSSVDADIDVGGIEADVELYHYIESTSRNGSSGSEVTLQNNIYVPGDDNLGDNAYKRILPPSISTIIGGDALPGDKFSVAILIKNKGSRSGLISGYIGNLSVLGLTSEIDSDNIKHAFSVTLTRVCHQLPNKSEVTITNSLISYATNQHFGTLNSTHTVFEGASLGPVSNTDTSTVIVFFDLYFDPTIADSDGSSNNFMNQTLRVGKFSFLMN